jgi:hypothetical protein
MVLRGSSRLTVDIDVCYGRDQANLERLAAALAPFHPRLRGAPPDLPFLWDKATLASGGDALAAHRGRSAPPAGPRT